MCNVQAGQQPRHHIFRGGEEGEGARDVGWGSGNLGQPHMLRSVYLRCDIVCWDFVMFQNYYSLNGGFWI